MASVQAIRAFLAFHQADHLAFIQVGAHGPHGGHGKTLLRYHVEPAISTSPVCMVDDPGQADVKLLHVCKVERLTSVRKGSRPHKSMGHTNDFDTLILLGGGISRG